MKEFLLQVVLSILLLASVVFNVVQSNRLALFESRFGTYESLSQNIKQENDSNYKKEQIITVYIKMGTSESKILSLKGTLENQSLVKSIQYISAEQALADFKARHQNDKATIEALNNISTNPLGATLIITITDPSKKQSLVNLIQTSDKNSIIDKINS